MNLKDEKQLIATVRFIEKKVKMIDTAIQMLRRDIRLMQSVKCVLCSHLGVDDSKDGIPLHNACWYSWLNVTHDGNVLEAINSLKKLYQQMSIIHTKTLNRHDHLNL